MWPSSLSWSACRGAALGLAGTLHRVKADSTQAEGSPHCIFCVAMQRCFQICSKPNLATVRRPELEALALAGQEQ